MTDYDPASRMTLYPLLDAKYDNLFKQIVTAGWGVKSDGHVESPTGYFGLVEIPSHLGERVEMVAALELDGDDTLLFNEIERGWFITQHMDSGIIYVYEMKIKNHAETVYQQLERIYAEWDADGLDV